AGPDLGGVLVERDVPNPVDLVFDGPVAADISSEAFWRRFGCRQTGDPEYGDRGLDLDLPVFMAAFDAAAYRAGDVPFDQEYLGGVREPEVLGCVHDLDRAFLVAAVPDVGGGVGDLHATPVEGVDPVEQVGGVFFDGHDVVGAEFFDDEVGVGADGV